MADILILIYLFLVLFLWPIRLCVAHLFSVIRLPFNVVRIVLVLVIDIVFVVCGTRCLFSPLPAMLSLSKYLLSYLSVFAFGFRFGSFRHRNDENEFVRWSGVRPKGQFWIIKSFSWQPFRINGDANVLMCAQNIPSISYFFSFWMLLRSCGFCGFAARWQRSILQIMMILEFEFIFPVNLGYFPVQRLARTKTKIQPIKCPSVRTMPLDEDTPHSAISKCSPMKTIVKSETASLPKYSWHFPTE